MLKPSELLSASPGSGQCEPSLWGGFVRLYYGISGSGSKWVTCLESATLPTRKTSFVDLEKEYALCSLYKILPFSVLIELAILFIYIYIIELVLVLTIAEIPLAGR